MAPRPLAHPAPRQATIARTVAAIVWARRWKLLTVAGVYVLGRSCPHWPAWAEPFCELLAKLASAMPG